MDAFALKYGNHSITLAQSRQLIGVKPKQDRAVEQVVQRTLPAKSWKAEGKLGGFQLVSICDRSVDVDQALDEIRGDASILVGTHVFELPERRGIFVPTGELFAQFKPGASAELMQKIIDEFGLSVREARGAHGFLLAVTPRSPNPMKVAFELRRKSCVCVAEPDLASSAVIKVFASDAMLAAQSRFCNAGFLRRTKTGLANAEGAGSLLSRFAGARQMSEAELLRQSAPVCRQDIVARAIRRRQATQREDATSGSDMPAAPAVVDTPIRTQEPSMATAPTIEIVIGAVTIRVPAGVDLQTLQTVLRAVRSTSRPGET